MRRRPRFSDRLRGGRILHALALLAALVPSGQAAAQPAACNAANLLAGALPVAGNALGGRPAVATDGVAGPEGAIWDSTVAVVLGGPGARGAGSATAAEPGLAWDLGRAAEVRALLLQADANDRYALTSSLDGVAFEPLGEIAAVPGRHGLVTRTLSIPARRLRFLRVAAVAGDGRYSLSELQAFCSPPQPWPPRLRVVAAPLASPAPSSRDGWNDATSRWWELALALGGFCLLLWHLRLERRGGPPARRRLADRLLAAAGVVAALTYFNFGAFHFGNYLHGWDTFHYYVGAKYFRELGYERLYECVALADATDPAWREPVATRRITDLRTNELVPAAGVLADPGRCTERFSASRWRDFRRDVAWFRARETAARWEELSTDHGFNATPVWMLAGSLLANAVPAGDGRGILALTLLDPLYFLALVAVAWWGFGWRATSVALLVFATSFPCRFFWTGGAFLRWDWLFYTVAAVACLRRGRPLLGGMALGYAALLRVFPGLLALGPLVALLSVVLPRAWRAQSGARGLPRFRALAAELRRSLGAEPARALLRFLAGAALAAAVLLPATLPITGAAAFPGFVANSRKHAATPLTNNMGLLTVLTYRPAEVGRVLLDDAATDPWAAWKEARLRARRTAAPFVAVVALLAVAALARAARLHPEPWVAAALGTVAIPIAVELTSYYYAFVLVPALLWTRRRLVGPLLLALSALGTFVSLAPLPGMPTWRDEQYTAISLFTLVALAAVLALFARAAAPETPETPETVTAAEEVPRGRERRARERRRGRRRR